MPFFQRHISELLASDRGAPTLVVLAILPTVFALVLLLIGDFPIRDDRIVLFFGLATFAASLLSGRMGGVFSILLQSAVVVVNYGEAEVGVERLGVGDMTNVALFLVGQIAVVYGGAALRGALSSAHREVRRYQEGEKRFDVAQRSAGVGYWEVDLILGQVFWSAAFCEALGIPEGMERSNENFFTFVHPEDWQDISIALDVARVTGDFRVEFRIHPRFGVRWFQSVGKLTENEHGIPAEMTGVVMDITAVKKIQDALRESERRFRSLADSLPQLVWSASSDGRVDYCNDRWLEFTGEALSPEHPCSWIVAVQEADRKRVEAEWNSALVEKREWKTECRLNQRHGESRWFTVQAVPMRDHNEAVVRWFGACSDIHDQKIFLAERESLLESEQVARCEAERANNSKDQFVAVLSHELRTPLNAILGWSQMIRRGKLSDDRLQHAIEVIEKNTKIQAQLISDLLDINRIVSGKMRLESAVFDLRDVCASTVHSILPSASAKGVNVVTELEACGDFSGDPIRIQQVVWNLLTNAVKFTPEGGEIRMQCRRIGSQVRLTVSDTGEGIPPELLTSIFDRYSQGDLSSVRKHGGLGLGLSIVKHIVELHGGEVSAASAGKGGGAIFTVVFPVKQPLDTLHPREGGMADVVQLPLDGCLRGRRILVIDDQLDARDLVRSILADDGASVFLASGVQEALQRIDEVAPELIVSDIGMPDQDGYSFIKRLRESGSRFAGLPAIALTAFARPEDRRQALEAGFTAHLTKPIDAKRLVSAVLSLLSCERAGNE